MGNSYLMFAHYRGESAALESAVACFESAAAVYREVGYEYGAATVLTNLGATYYDLGRYDEAADRLLAALELTRRAGNGPSEATALQSLGNVAVARGEPAKARSFLEQALEVRRSIGDQFGEASALEKLADIDAAEGANAAAARRLDQAAALLVEIDPVWSMNLRSRAAKLC